MKLSEAIRRGLEFAPNQAFARLFDPAHEAACALGTAVCGAHGKTPAEISNEDLGNSPLSRLTEGEFYYITKLNDEEGYSRERIAAILEKEGY